MLFDVLGHERARLRETITNQRRLIAKLRLAICGIKKTAYGAGVASAAAEKRIEARDLENARLREEAETEAVRLRAACRERDQAREQAIVIAAERDRLHAFVGSLAARAAAQAELLVCHDRAGADVLGRLAELEAALAPLLAALAGGWDDGTLPGDALYPVKMDDLRRLAIVAAGSLPADGLPAVASS